MHYLNYYTLFPISKINVGNVLVIITLYEVFKSNFLIPLLLIQKMKLPTMFRKYLQFNPNAPIQYLLLALLHVLNDHFLSLVSFHLSVIIQISLMLNLFNFLNAKFVFTMISMLNFHSLTTLTIHFLFSISELQNYRYNQFELMD